MKLNKEKDFAHVIPPKIWICTNTNTDTETYFYSASQIFTQITNSELHAAARSHSEIAHSDNKSFWITIQERN